MATKFDLAKKTEMYQFFSIAFNAAPGVTYMNQLQEAVVSGMSTKEIVNVFSLKPQFTSVYPAFTSDDAFAAKLIENVVGASATAAAKAEAIKDTVAALASGYTRGDVVWQIFTNLAAKTGDAMWGGTATMMANKVAVAAYYTETLATDTTDLAALRGVLAGVTATTDVSTSVALAAALPGATNSTSQSLSTAQDSLTGTAGNDLFTANIFDNSNTLQSGDKVTGGAGVDRLNADIGNSQKFAITPETTGVEQVAIRAQAVAVDSANNNLQNAVQIDAQRMVGVTQWESNNSRADLLIEDIRILPTQITKDITIAMVETDPGHVDMGVYFDQYSLRNAPSVTSGAVLRLQLMDTRSSDAGTAKLLNNPYNGFTFKLGTETISVTSPAIDAAQTYAELLVAVSAAVKALPALAAFTVALGQNFNAIDTISGKAQTGQEIVLTNTGVGVVSTDATTGWTTSGVVPSSSGLHTFVTSAPASTAVFKVTSTVILDDVGRGSTAGDLVIGGLSVGDTSSSKGVERFEIEVRDNSKLESIQSTNNTLQEVTIKNGVTTSSSFAYVGTAANSGNLTVNGNSGLNGVSGLAGDAQTGSNTRLPGTTDASNLYGFSDVRLIDATAMTGNLAFTAQITEKSIAKYMNLVDTQAAPAPDAANGNGAIANFDYKGGNGADTLVVDIDASVADSRNTVISGREDFTFAIDGGAGNDAITVKIVNATNTGSSLNWYSNQDLNNNIAVNGGAGNDTIRTPGAGDMKIDGGAGDDTIYTDNTGATKAQFVFNTADQTATGFAARNAADLRSGTNDTYNLTGSKVTITFKGVVSQPFTVAGSNSTTTDLEINQAIKAAITNDAVLSKLLLATDGPANSLVVTSAIDGALTAADLTVSLAFTAPALGTLTPLEIFNAGKVYLAAGTVATEANVIAAMNAAFATLTAKGDYATAFTNTGTAALASITGTASTTTSDNFVAGSAGNDVIVLGTTVDGLSVTGSSNETLVVGAGFGNDTVLNFALTGFGADRIDFSGIGGTAAGLATADKSIVVVAGGANTTALVAAEFGAANVAAQTHVYVSVNGTVGTVYSVADAIGAGAVATLEGTINLAGSGWTGMTYGSNALVGGPNGSTGATGAPVVVTPVVPSGTVAVTAANTVAFDAAAANNTFSVTQGNYTYNIANFGAGDKLAFVTAGSAPSFTNTTFGDGIVDVSYAAGGQTVVIHLTGLANDGTLNSAAGFNALFGAGTIA